MDLAAAMDGLAAATDGLDASAPARRALERIQKAISDDVSRCVAPWLQSYLPYRVLPCGTLAAAPAAAKVLPDGAARGTEIHSDVNLLTIQDYVALLAAWVAALVEPTATLLAGGALRGGLLGVASALVDAAVSGGSGAPHTKDSLLSLLRLLDLDAGVATCARSATASHEC